jgi:hypothetical protein
VKNEDMGPLLRMYFIFQCSYRKAYGSLKKIEKIDKLLANLTNEERKHPN